MGGGQHPSEPPPPRSLSLPEPGGARERAAQSGSTAELAASLVYASFPDPVLNYSLRGGGGNGGGGGGAGVLHQPVGSSQVFNKRFRTPVPESLAPPVSPSLPRRGAAQRPG